MSDGEFQIPERDPGLQEIPSIMTGIDLITSERFEHKLCGRTIKYDVENNMDGQLAQAAAALIEGDITWMPEGWDDEKCKKLMKKPYSKRLVVAAALLAAEIDRLNFKG